MTAPGARVSHYRIVRSLGEGGMGVVFEAVDENTNRTVVIKAIRGDMDRSERAVRRFEREGRAGAALRDPHVVTILDGGTSADGRPYLVFEHVAGGGLDRRLKQEGRLPWREVCTLGAGIARGLVAIHAAGMVHRDLKPANVLLAADGTPKISDLGLVRAEKATGLTQGGLTKTGEMLGTLHYIAPEQVDQARDVDHRADLYALGCLLHALMGGEPPFTDSSPMIVIKKHLLDPPPPLATVAPDVPAELEALVLALLAKDPGRRPQTAAEVVAALERIAAGEGARARRSRPLVVAGALGLVVAVAAGAALARGERSPRATSTEAVAPRDTSPPVPDRVALIASATALELRVGADWTIEAGARVTGLDVSQDGRWVVAGSAAAQGTIGVWTPEGQELGRVKSPDQPVIDLVVTSDRVVYAGHSGDRSVRRYAPVEGAEAAVALQLDPRFVLTGDAGELRALDARDGRVVSATGDRVRRYPIQDGAPQQQFEMGIDLARGSPDQLQAVRLVGPDLVLAAGEEYGLMLWRVADAGNMPVSYAPPLPLDGACALALAPDRRTAYAGTARGLIQRVVLGEQADGTPTLAGEPPDAVHAGRVLRLAISRSGRFGASICAETAELVVWRTDRRARTRHPLEKAPASVAWGPDDAWLVVGLTGGSVVRLELHPARGR